MEDNTGSRESKKKRMEDNTRSSESKEKRRKSMEDNTRSSESKEKKRKSMEDNTPTKTLVNWGMRGSGSGRGRAGAGLRGSSSGKPRDLIIPPVGARISSQSVPGQNIVLVRPRTLRQTNPKEHNGPVPMEGDEEIAEERAICKYCSHKLKEENILKTECGCSNSFIHENCAAKWSSRRGNGNCDNCGQEVQTFPVTLVRGLSSSTQVVGREKRKKSSLSSRLMRKA